MNAAETISFEIPPLRISETGEKALKWMDEFRVSHLPVLDKQNHYIGLVSEENILDMEDQKMPLSSISSNFVTPFIYEDAHMFEMMRLVGELKITVVPVLSKDNEYLGATPMLHLMKIISKMSSVVENGSIIVLEMSRHDYSLAEIAQLVESNDAKILSSYITSEPDSTLLNVTIKVNKLNVDAILQTFVRYSYNIVASYHQSRMQDDMKRRFEELMKYIKM
ncbi:MAG: CBS domain-containing protein [Crocinitomicaceae bacterium]